MMGTGHALLERLPLPNFTLEDNIRHAGLELKVERHYYKLTQADKSVDVAGGHGQVVSQRVEKFDRTEIPDLGTVNSGDLIEIELVIESKNDYEYILFEDMKAAGCEPVSLQSGYNGNEMGAYVELRDNRVSFFVRNLARGKHSVSYRMRAEIPGRFSALPTKASAMYAPELRGNSDELKLNIADVPAPTGEPAPTKAAAASCLQNDVAEFAKNSAPAGSDAPQPLVHRAKFSRINEPDFFVACLQLRVAQKGLAMSLVAEERILVVPTSLFRDLGYFQGFSRETDRYWPRIVEGDHVEYRARGEMEADPRLCQATPSRTASFVGPTRTAMSTSSNTSAAAAAAKPACMPSTASASAATISSIDAEVGHLHDVYREGMRRELEEEVIIETPYKETVVGLINDDETPVGQVHLGMVHLCDVEKPNVRPLLKADILGARFSPVADILTRLEQFESWSEIAVRAAAFSQEEIPFRRHR